MNGNWDCSSDSSPSASHMHAHHALPFDGLDHAQILQCLDARVESSASAGEVLALLDGAKVPLHESLARATGELPAKLLTLKILNLLLAKHHFRMRSERLLSAPFGIVVDPMNGCQLACPGCVH